MDVSQSLLDASEEHQFAGVKIEESSHMLTNNAQTCLDSPNSPESKGASESKNNDAPAVSGFAEKRFIPCQNVDVSDRFEKDASQFMLKNESPSTSKVKHSDLLQFTRSLRQCKAENVIIKVMRAMP